MKRLFLTLVVIFSIFSCTPEMQRSIKDVKSGLVGLNRKVSVVGGNGEIIKIYEGRIDIEVNEYGNKVKFENNGKRVMLYNLGVIVEEQ